MKKLKVALVGCGGMAKAHVRRFEGVMDRMELTAVVDVDKERAEAVADLYPGDPIVETDYKNVYDDVDAALLVLPHQLHYSATLDFLKAGKHVLLEKPMANTEEECEEIIRVAAECGNVLMIAYCMRYHPLVVKMKEILDAETYGKCFQLSIWTEQHTEREPDSWICKADQVGGGQLFSHGCHYIDLMLWMMGKPVSGIHFGTNRGTPWMEREGTSNVVIEFENGATGYHFGTWGARGTRLKYAFHAHCEKGLVELDFSKGCLNFIGDAAAHVPGFQGEEEQKEVCLMENNEGKATLLEMEHFIDCVQHGKKPLTDPVSSLEGLRVIWELYKAEDDHSIANLRGLGLGSISQ